MSGQTSPATNYSTAQKALHWVVVVLLLLQYFVFDGMGRPFRDMMQTGFPVWTTTSIAHLAIGLTVLVLAIGRIALRLRHGAPAAPAAEPELFRKLSKIAHGAIYGLLLLLPVSGMVAWFGQQRNAAETHEIFTSALMVLVVVHVVGVAVHQFYWKTGLMRRMI